LLESSERDVTTPLRQATYSKNFFTTASPYYPTWFNTAAFTSASAGSFGTMRPFSLRGPGFVNMDVAVSKIFPIYERYRLELRGESFNVLNHPNYSNPISVYSSSATFGRITSTANDPRLLQLAAKVTF
jgi:hypothetical protein